MALFDQLLAQGLTQQQATELARAFNAQGVTDLSQLTAEAGGYNHDYGTEGQEGRGQWNIQGEGDRVWMPYESQATREWNPNGAGYRLLANGQALGHFNIGETPQGYRTTGNGLNLDELQQGGGDNFSQFAYSAAGNDGTEYFISGINADGTPRISARSVSSNDDLGEIRAAAAVAALMGAGASGLLGGGSAGAAGDVALSSVPEMVSAGSMGNAAQVIGTIPTVNASTGLLAGGAAAGAAGGAGTVAGGNGITAGTASGGNGLYGLTADGNTTSLSQGLTGSGLTGGTGAGLSVGGLTNAASGSMDLKDWLKLGTQVGGAIAGAASSGDKTAEAKREPWAESIPYLKGLLSDTKSLYEQQRQTPFNPVQSKYMNQMLGNVDYFNNMVAPGLLGWAGNIAAGSYNYDRRRPFTNQPIAARWGEGAAIPAANVNFNGLLGGK